MAVIGFAGTYRCDAVDLISLHLPTYDVDWPRMNLKQDLKSLLLTTSIKSDRGQTYWPFRPVETSEEERVRAMMES